MARLDTRSAFKDTDTGPIDWTLAHAAERALPCPRLARPPMPA